MVVKKLSVPGTLVFALVSGLGAAACGDNHGSSTTCALGDAPIPDAVPFCEICIEQGAGLTGVAPDPAAGVAAAAAGDSCDKHCVDPCGQCPAGCEPEPLA